MRLFYNTMQQKLTGSYCEFVKSLPAENLHRKYHDEEYGFTLDDDNALFARLILEINQAGLSWETILKKKENFFKAYDNFHIDSIASYTENDRLRLMNDSGIIRNRLKINAAIENAKSVLRIQKEFGSFKNFLDKHKGLQKDQWVKLFKMHFKFVGGEIVNEFLMSTGYLPGAHVKDCEIYQRIANTKRKNVPS